VLVNNFSKVYMKIGRDRFDVSIDFYNINIGNQSLVSMLLMQLSPFATCNVEGLEQYHLNQPTEVACDGVCKS